MGRLQCNIDLIAAQSECFVMEWLMDITEELVMLISQIQLEYREKVENSRE